MTLYVIVGIIALLAVLLLMTYNKLVMLRNKVKEALSTMDVYLKKRFDLVPELVAVVKGYAKHESSTLEQITQMRTGNNLSDRLNSENRISEQLSKIMVSVEAYPELKADQNFRQLQSQLMQIEEDIASSRRYYNGSVREYNNNCQTVPTNIVAGMFGFKLYPMFEAKAEERNIADYEL